MNSCFLHVPVDVQIQWPCAQAKILPRLPRRAPPHARRCGQPVPRPVETRNSSAPARAFRAAASGRSRGGSALTWLAGNLEGKGVGRDACDSSSISVQSQLPTCPVGEPHAVARRGTKHGINPLVLETNARKTAPCDQSMVALDGTSPHSEAVLAFGARSERNNRCQLENPAVDRCPATGWCRR
jgi:hypothetical protein